MLPRSRADAIAAFLSGAGSAGGAQADPDLSLGNFRSSSRAGSLGHLLTGVLHGVRVDFAAGANGAGTGSLEATDVSSLRWTPPGGTPGGAVAIADGEQKLLEGSDPSKFVLVTRTSADDLSGVAGVELVPVFNDVIAQADQGPSKPVQYRLVVLKNGPHQAVRALRVWLGDCTHVVAIALEQPASQPDGAFQTVASATTAPTGVTFVSPTSAVHADAIAVGTLNPNDQVGIWIRRDATAAVATPRAELGIAFSYTAVG